jgi:hypothetical protein
VNELVAWMENNPSIYMEVDELSMYFEKKARRG